MEGRWTSTSGNSDPAMATGVPKDYNTGNETG